MGWDQFTEAFLSYHDGLLSREQTQRELETPRFQAEPLEMFVWRKHEVYSLIYPNSDEAQVTQSIIGCLHPNLKIVLR